MKILVLSDLFLPKIGGTEIQASRLAEGLAREGHDVEVWTGRWDDSWLPVEELLGVKVLRLETGQRWLNRRGLRKWMNVMYMQAIGAALRDRMREFDVVHAQSLLYGAAVAVQEGIRQGVPVLVKETNSGLRSSYRELETLFLGGWMRRRFHRDLRHVVVLNEQAAQEYTGWPFADLTIHPAVNGIEVPIQPAAISADPPVLLFVGRFRPEKGLHILLQAWSIAGPGSPRWRLRIVGDGEERAEVQRILEQTEGRDRVELVGYDRDTSAHYRSATAFVLPSLSEGMSNALLEAMAHGLPCLATNVGASGAMLSGEAGWVCPPGDVAALARALERLMATPPEVLVHRGAQARDRVQAQYSREASLRRYVEIYSSLLS